MSNFVENLVRRAAGLAAEGDARPAMAPEAIPLAVEAGRFAPQAPARAATMERSLEPKVAAQGRERGPQPAPAAPSRVMSPAPEPRSAPAVVAHPQVPEAPVVLHTPVLYRQVELSPRAPLAEIRGPAGLADRLPARRGNPPEPPPVEVHIDSIEVRAPAQPPPAAPAPARTAPVREGGFGGYGRIRSYRGWERTGDRP